MRQISILLCIVFCSTFSSCTTPGNLNITTTIKDTARAKKFDEKYQLVLPCHDYTALFRLFSPQLFDSSEQKGHDMSYILTNSIFGKNIVTVPVKKTLTGNYQKSALTEVWMQPLSRDDEGFSYLDHTNIIFRKYNSNDSRSLSISKDIPPTFDRHSIANVGDSLYYYAVEDFHRNRSLFGKDTTVVDFDFYELNTNTKKSRLLFSASNIVPDSMLVPQLFEANGIYTGLDIYHWNWIQVPSPGKLLINFAFAGFYQVDLKTNKIDWYWGFNGHSFSSIKGLSNTSMPFYTHDVNRITSGPYKGYYSYYENGSNADSVKSFRPARARIFRINPSDNSAEIVFEKIYDIAPIAMGNVSVVDDYVLVNLGMTTPGHMVENILIKSGGDIKAAVDFLKNYKHPQIYIYDLKGNEISNYTYPYGFLSYIAWIKRK